MTVYDARSRSIFLGVLLALAALLLFTILQPYVVSLMLALILAVTFRPVFLAISKRIGNREVLASLLTTLLIILIIVVPFTFFGTLAFKEIAAAISSPNQFTLNISNAHLPDLLQKFNVDFKSYIQTLSSSLLNDAGGIFSNLAQFFIYAVLTIIALVYFFKDGDKLLDQILTALPFTKDQADKLTKDLESGIRAIIGGYLLIGVIQGIVSGIGFWIFGIPNPALWGFVTFLAALIPTFGSSLVNIPAILFLFFSNQVGHAIGLTIWWLVAISIIDNFIGPKFVSGRVKIHPLLIIFSIIGGINVFGPFGFLMGPMIVIFFWSILGIFQDRKSSEE